jgi:hypothetical protein
MVIGDMTHPARAPIPALSMKESVTMLRVLMPHRMAALRLAAQAFISRPTDVVWKKTLRNSTIKPHMADDPYNLRGNPGTEDCHRRDFVPDEIGQ